MVFGFDQDHAQSVLRAKGRQLCHYPDAVSRCDLSWKSLRCFCGRYMLLYSCGRCRLLYFWNSRMKLMTAHAVSRRMQQTDSMCSQGSLYVAWGAMVTAGEETVEESEPVVFVIWE